MDMLAEWDLAPRGANTTLISDTTLIGSWSGGAPTLRMGTPRSILVFTNQESDAFCHFEISFNRYVQQEVLLFVLLLVLLLLVVIRVPCFIKNGWFGCSV